MEVLYNDRLTRAHSLAELDGDFHTSCIERFRPINEERFPQLWGGVECTVNRVGDQFFDQLARNGHAERLTDLDLITDLGIRTLRYPILWERTAPHGIALANWTWPDERLNRLRELGIQPIVGLVHHGSGPEYTSLVDPEFPEKLANYAQAVAARYPWVGAYTPINEITTTARFSGLYGHWYPHGRDGRTFSRILVNQCRAVALAMTAIREVNSDASLVQTDDLGKTRSTPPLAYQANFDNQRRWLGWDLLCGLVNPAHFFWEELVREGISDGELQWFLENPCPPDIIGVNYYITSERFLDHRLERYPERTHGSNNWTSYADVEAVRVCADGIAGAYPLIRETWERYKRPIAITEAHLGCTLDEQLRWLAEIWRDATYLREDMVDLRAVTVWSLLGAYNWNCLLTRDEGHYEPGAFDLRRGEPQPTALAALVRELATGCEPEHPALNIPGWWRRPERLLHPRVQREEIAG
jgi:dTDP-4-dehydrorhamnose reductase